MVSRANFAELRELNFGVRALRHPITADYLGRQIDGYAPDEAAAVRDLLRSQAGRTHALKTLLEIYHRAMNAPRETTPLAEATGAAARYLERIAPRVKGFEEATARLTALAATLGTVQEQAATSAAAFAVEREQAAAERVSAQSREAALETSLAAAEARVATLEAQALLVHHSPAMRLRRGVLALPLVGGLARAVARTVCGAGRRPP